MDHLTEAEGLRRYPLPRRGLMMTSLISGFTLATTTVLAQAIHTDTTGLDAGEVKIPVADGVQLPAYYARPAGPGPFPTVLVIEEVFGVNDYLKDVCRRLAKAGYLAVAPEIYARLGDLSKMTDIATVIRDVVAKAPDATMLSDLDATAAWAAANRGNPAKLAVTGFCRGGRHAWLYAEHNPNLKAAVSWYGTLTGPRTDIQPKTAGDLVTELKCPMLALYGGQDGSIKIEDVQAGAARAKAAGKTVEIIVYPDAPHGFHADYRPSYREADAKDGWQRMLNWFRTYGVAPA